MQRLLYHAPDNPNQESPFDRAIVQVVQGQEASIVSPYIGLQYLQRLIRLSRSWRLISDVLEWLSATPPKDRSAVYEFLKENKVCTIPKPSPRPATSTWKSSPGLSESWPWWTTMRPSNPARTPLGATTRTLAKEARMRHMAAQVTVLARQVAWASDDLRKAIH